MKRTDISALFPDATEEQISQIMNLNGADINKAKGDLTSLQGQLKTAQDELQQLKAGGGDNALKAQIDTLQNELNGMKQAESLRTMRSKVAGEKKVPVELLTGETEESCASQADAILSFARSSGYPAVPDGGEAHNPPSPKTRDKFAEWAKDNL